MHETRIGKKLKRRRKFHYAKKFIRNYFHLDGQRNYILLVFLLRAVLTLISVRMTLKMTMMILLETESDENFTPVYLKDT